MICQICNKRKATITLQTNINGVNKTLNICQQCAKEKNHLLFPKPFLDSLAKQQNLPPFLESLLKQFNQPSFDKVYGMFSEHANKAMYIAQEECKKLGHGLLDTGHMLLGLLKEKIIFLAVPKLLILKQCWERLIFLHYLLLLILTGLFL